MPGSPAKTGKSGSPSKGEPVYLAVGHLRRPHGVHGDILMDVYTDFPERIKSGSTLFLGAKHRPASVLHIRHHNEGLLVAFDGVDTPESASLFRNQTVYVKTADRPDLEKGQYYHHQIIGMSVVDDEGKSLGKVTEIIETGANDVYVVKSTGSQELLLPAIKDVIRQVDIDKNIMTVHLIPGLIEKEE